MVALSLKLTPFMIISEFEILSVYEFIRKFLPVHCPLTSKLDLLLIINPNLTHAQFILLL